MSPLAIGLIIALAVIVLFGAAAVVVWLLSSKSSSNFDLTQSRSYQQELKDIENHFYKAFSRTKIEAAAQTAVAKEKKKGVTSDQKLEDAGLAALAAALKEPHTEYLNADENRRLNEDISGSFYGVGIVLRETGPKGNQRPIAFDLVKGSPAEKGGIKKEDTIISVDGKDTKNVNVDIVVTWIRGQNGTKVKLVIKRKGVAKNMTFNLTRAKVQIPEIESKIMNGNIGYIRLYSFDKGVGDKVRGAVKDLTAKGAKGFIFDLRSNPGGLLEESVTVSDVFINNGVIVSYKGADQPKTELKAAGNAETTLPLVVMVNGGSASAAEITSGALKDYNRGTLVGTKTYGKGSVQQIYPLVNSGAAKITVALYYLPNGESIDGKGIQPDIKVEVKGNLEAEDKAQLDAATKAIENLIQGKPATAGELKDAA